MKLLFFLSCFILTGCLTVPDDMGSGFDRQARPVQDYVGTYTGIDEFGCDEWDFRPDGTGVAVRAHFPDGQLVISYVQHFVWKPTSSGIQIEYTAPLGGGIKASLYDGFLSFYRDQDDRPSIVLIEEERHRSIRKRLRQAIDQE